MYLISIRTSNLYDPFNLLFTGEMFNNSCTMEVFLMIFFLRNSNHW